MKKFIVGVLLIIAVDQILGFTLGFLYQRTTTGEGGGVINFALTKAPNILILGSSRAKHHIDPAILSQYLSMSAFNAGIDGHDFLYAMMFFDLWQRLHPPPRVILLHVDVASFVKNEEELQKTSIFSYYIDQSDVVKRIIFARSRYEPLKLLSSSYRFNGKLLSILKNQFVVANEQDNGYLGLVGEIKWNGASSHEAERKDQVAPFWQEKLTLLKKLADYCAQNATRLVLVYSPRFRENSLEHTTWTTNLSRLLMAYPAVEWIDISEHTHPEVFARRADLYRDTSHLNRRGAELFSHLLAKSLEGKLGR